MASDIFGYEKVVVFKVYYDGFCVWIVRSDGYLVIFGLINFLYCIGKFNGYRVCSFSFYFVVQVLIRNGVIGSDSFVKSLWFGRCFCFCGFSGCFFCWSVFGIIGKQEGSKGVGK